MGQLLKAVATGAVEPLQVDPSLPPMLTATVGKMLQADCTIPRLADLAGVEAELAKYLPDGTHVGAGGGRGGELACRCGRPARTPTRGRAPGPRLRRQCVAIVAAPRWRLSRSTAGPVSAERPCRLPPRCHYLLAVVVAALAGGSGLFAWRATQDHAPLASPSAASLPAVVASASSAMTSVASAASAERSERQRRPARRPRRCWSPPLGPWSDRRPRSGGRVRISTPAHPPAASAASKPSATPAAGAGGLPRSHPVLTRARQCVFHAACGCRARGHGSVVRLRDMRTERDGGSRSTRRGSELGQSAVGQVLASFERSFKSSHAATLYVVQCFRARAVHARAREVRRGARAGHVSWRRAPR